MQITDLTHPQLTIASFEVHPGESWCFYGANRSGIDDFVELISGRLSGYQASSLTLPADLGVLSFRSQQELFEKELRNDDSNFLDRPDPGTLVREFLAGYGGDLQILDSLGLAHLLDHGYRQLSSGQSRKLLIVCELLKGNQVLLLQNPFDGLDVNSCSELNQLLAHLNEQGSTILITVNNIDDIPQWCSHLALFRGRSLAAAGRRAEIHSLLADDEVAEVANAAPPANILTLEPSPVGREELITLRNGKAAYGDNLLFSGLNLTVCTGDHTLITGPNGCGKSTLLDMLTGDHPYCYINDLCLFGRTRGSGESIWDIKQKMGIVSPGLHRDHRVPGNATHIILSGLYDTIGLYRRPHSPETRMAHRWLAWLEMADAAETPFRRLSFAEQRLVLIGRALIKGPRLLILDEPTQGLDQRHRNRVLALLEKCARERLATILFVSHRQDEHRDFFTQHLQLSRYSPGATT